MDIQLPQPYTIGRLAAIGGLSVKTVRFDADEGLVPEVARTPAGYRLFDRQAAERLGLVRTLRDLGIGLATIRRVLARDVTVAAVAADHAQALDVQIRMLQLRRAVLRAVARRGSNPEEVQLMDRLVQVSNEERRRMLEDFLDSVFGGVEVDPAFEARMRSVTPDLPEDPTPAQIEAWVELAELLGQDDFRSRIRRMAEQAGADRADAEQAGADRAGSGSEPGGAAAAAAVIAQHAGSAVEQGVDPTSRQAAAVLNELVAAYAAVLGQADGPAFRRELLRTLETFTDRRAERYWQLLAVIKGWAPIPSRLAPWEWTITALRAAG